MMLKTRPKTHRYAIARNNDYGGGSDTAPIGTLTAESIPYKYSALKPEQIAVQVPGEAGAILTFDASDDTVLPPLPFASSS